MASTGPDQRQAVKAKPLRGDATAPALTAGRRSGFGPSKQTKAGLGVKRALQNPERRDGIAHRRENFPRLNPRLKRKF
jgi:hypothetical protein